MASKGQKPAAPLKVDFGSEDCFLHRLGLPELRGALRGAGKEVEWGEHAGHGHSYFFVSSVVGGHLEFHKRHLG
jgi:S-formylglutathione hydrolase